MGKPLLTDEIIERANHGEIFYDDPYLEDDEETKVIRTDLYDTIVPYEEEEEKNQGFLDKWKDRKKKDQYVYKSRRIENAKRSKFQRKLNLIMFVVIVLLIALFFAVFNL
ncbi:cell wall synthase accessory phosphoprotein MacP [Streptococcus macedonicus]|uniref:cell wall synthase accessory phosphoprotein MacP n=1 Tax=Streptococcus macedonicus TaxID=59310 RepID=UPI002244A0A8|nr:cell wall synthase accessory phosphoprotein MacP [Streptococcus macedonicus]MCW8645291.1 cell wall synthase accessory phosphoprotein MacP [Streptococcus macedonicus]